MNQDITATIRQLRADHDALLTLLAEALPPKFKPRCAELLKSNASALDHLSNLKPQAGVHLSDGWAKRREANKLYLFEFADEPPRRVDYDEVGPLWGLAPHTIRIRISQSTLKAIVVFRNGRHQVLAKDPKDLQAALDSRFHQTQNPDDRFALTKRSRPPASGPSDAPKLEDVYPGRPTPKKPVSGQPRKS